jgi:hypothetical protein
MDANGGRALRRAARGAIVTVMRTSSVERRTAALALFLVALGGCGARSELFDGAGGSGGLGGLGGGSGGQGAGPVDAGLDAQPILDAGFDASPGCPVPVQSCYTGPPGTMGVGACHAGQQVCADGGFGPCMGEVLPSPEICDGVDNNCNGVADEGTCAVGTVCANSIQTDLVQPPQSWVFNGSASWAAASSRAVLTPAVGAIAGTMIYKNPIVTDAFTVSFAFVIGGGDGLAFMIETQGSHALGSDGGGMGVAGLGGYAVELDTYDNGLMCGDPDANHVGLDDLAGTCGMGLPVPLGSATVPVDLGDQQRHTARIQFDAGMVALVIDSGQPVTFIIPGWVSGKAYYYGLGAGTGAAVGLQVVEGPLVIDFPTYRCL